MTEWIVRVTESKRSIGEQNRQVEIGDFDPAADRLLVLYDPALHPAPLLTVETGDHGDTLLLDGVRLASLTNGASIDLSRITLRAA